MGWLWMAHNISQLCALRGAAVVLFDETCAQCRSPRDEGRKPANQEIFLEGERMDSRAWFFWVFLQRLLNNHVTKSVVRLGWRKVAVTQKLQEQDWGTQCQPLLSGSPFRAGTSLLWFYPCRTWRQLEVVRSGRSRSPGFTVKTYITNFIKFNII